MILVPIPDEPALLYDKMRALIVGDLHLGLEKGLADRGVVIPSQTWAMLQRIIDIVELHDLDTLVLVGDVKDSVGLTSYQEARELPKFFERLLAHVDTIEIAPGNHDGRLVDIVPKEVKIHPSSGFVFGDVGLFHGHSWPDAAVLEKPEVVMAHNHAAVTMVETLGRRESKPCWVRLNLNLKESLKRYPNADPTVVMMPAFNPFCGGTGLNEKGRRLLGPMLKNKIVDLGHGRVYLLDGTFLGEIRKMWV